MGTRDKNQETRHLDGNRANNRLDNLIWGTKTENYADRHNHGTANNGERHGRAKLTNDKVREIRNLYAAGRATQTQLAEMFGVNQTKISNIVRRESWSHIP